MLIDNVTKYLTAFVVGVLLTAFVGIKFCYISFVLICLAIICALVFSKFIRIEKLWSLFLVMAMGSACFCFHIFFVYSPAVEFSSTTQRVSGTVTEISNYDYGNMCYIVKVSKIGDKQFYIPFNLKIYTNSELLGEYGDYISADVLLSEAVDEKDLIFSGNMSRCNYLKGKIKSENDVEILKNFDILSVFSKCRKFLVNSVCMAITEPQSHIINGLVFGENSKIPYSIKRAVDRCGLSHIFSVSGLHISILSCVLIYFLRLIKTPKIISVLILTICLFCFSAIVGMRASVIRASIMVLFSNAFLLLNKKASKLNGLLLAATLILIFSPTAILGLSFILSFSSCAGILLFSKSILIWARDKFNLYRNWQLNILQLLSVSLSANLASAPFLIFAFGKISIISPLVNLIILPFVPLVFILGFVTAVSGLILTDLSNVLGYICEGLCGAVFYAIKLIASLPFCNIPANYEFVSITIFCLALFLLFTLFIKRGIFTKRFILVCFAIIVLIPTTSNMILGAKTVTLTTIGNGYGYSLVLRGEGKTIVINCGGGLCSGRRLCEFLDSRGIFNIDVLIFTSIKSKHMMDELTVIENIPVSSLVLSNNAKYSALFKAASDRKIDIFSIDRLNMESDSFKIDSIYKNNSTSLLISLGGVCFAYSDNISNLKNIENLQNKIIAILDQKSNKHNEEINFKYSVILDKNDYNFPNSFTVAPDDMADFIFDGEKVRRGKL